MYFRQYMYAFSLITGFFLTCSNTTPTITIFVSLLFDKTVSMVKHIMDIVRGNTEFIKAGQIPVLGMRMIDCHEVGLKNSQKIHNCFIWNCTFRNDEVKFQLSM